MQESSIQYIHHVPGRLRLRVPQVRRNATAAASLERVLHRTPGIRSVEARALTGSVVIHYNCSQTNATAVVRILDEHEYGIQPAGAPHVAAPLTATVALIPRGYRPNRSATRPQLVRRRQGSFVTGPDLTSWLLKKALEIALERSLVLLIAAVL